MSLSYPKPLAFKDGLNSGRTTRASTIPPKTWLEHQNVIHQKYMVEKMALKQLIPYMEVNHKFTATKHQYTSQFEKWKYFKKSGDRTDSIGGPSEGLSTPSEDGYDDPSPTDDITARRLGENVKDTGRVSNESQNDSKKADEVAEEPPKRIQHILQRSDLLSARLHTRDISFSSSLGSSTLDSATADSSSERSRLRNCDSPATTVQSNDKEEIVASTFADSTDEGQFLSASFLRIFDPLDGHELLPAKTFYLPEFSLSHSASHPQDSHDVLEIPIQDLSINDPATGTILVQPACSNFSKDLSKLFRSNFIATAGDFQSQKDTERLLKVGNFLFAAQSFEDAFGSSRTSVRLLNHHSPDVRLSLQLDNAPILLLALTNMARSARTREQFVEVARATAQARSGGSFNAFRLNKDYNLLQTYLGDRSFRLTRHQRETRQQALVSCWKEALSMPHRWNYVLVSHLISTALREMEVQPGGDGLDITAHRLLSDILKNNTASSIHDDTDKSMSKQLSAILSWAVGALQRDEFYYMVSNVDETFWTLHGDTLQHDILLFEIIVVQCYLTERLWYLQSRSDSDQDEQESNTNVLKSFQELHHQTGLSYEDIIAAMVSRLAHVDPDTTVPMVRLSLPARYLAYMEYLYHQTSLATAGYHFNDQFLTVDKLIDEYYWPRKASSTSCTFVFKQYAQNVWQFLREFLLVSFESDLTERLDQARNHFQPQGKGETTIAPPASASARSSQMSEDFVKFRKAAKRISQISTMSTTGSLQMPTTGLDDLFSDVSGSDKLFRYSNSTNSLNSSSHMSISGSSLRNSARVSSSGDSMKQSLRLSVSTHSLARSSIMEVDEPDTTQEKTRRNPKDILRGARRMFNLSMSSSNTPSRKVGQIDRGSSQGNQD